MKISLKIKIMTAFFVLIGLPMTALGISTYNRTYQALQESTQSELKQQAGDAATFIEKSIDSVKGDVEIASLNSQLSDLMQNSTSQEYIDEAFDYITKVQSDNDEYMEVLIVTDSVGKVIIDTRTKTPDVDLSDRDYMKNAISSGKTCVSEVLTSRFTQNPAIFIAVPVKVNDTVVGTVVGSIKFSTISDHVSDIKVGENGYGYMIDKDGLIVGHPNDEKVLRENISNSDDEGLKNLLKK